MKGYFLGFALVALSSCGQKDPIDCREAYERVDECLTSAAGVGPAVSWDTCIPHSGPVIMTGRFALAFEFNQFWEGPYADQEDPWSIPDVSTKLDIARPPRTNAAGDPIGTVSKITFEGRRPLCAVTTVETWLIVDRVLSEEIISTAPFYR